MNLFREWNELWETMQPGPVAQAELRSFIARADSVRDMSAITSLEYHHASAALAMANRNAHWFDEKTYIGVADVEPVQVCKCCGRSF